jgi:hypothetical protein
MSDDTTPMRAVRLRALHRWALLFSFFGIGVVAAIIFAPSANAVSGPTPSPGFTIVAQECREVGREAEQHPDGFDTIVTENEDGTTTTTLVPRYKTVWVTITKCEWVERKVTTGQGLWEKRPELSRTVPCFTLPEYGYPAELMEELCGNGADRVRDIEFPDRKPPTFADSQAALAYKEVSWAPGAVPAPGDSTLIGLTLRFLHNVDPTTQSALAAWPCYLTALDNSNPTIEIIDNLSLDRIDWAKFVNYKLTIYQQGSVTFRSPNSNQRLLVSKEGPTHLGANGRPIEGSPLKFINTGGFASTADWLSCKSATGGSGGIPTVRVSCPVFYNDVEVAGPSGEGLPALRDKNEYDPLTISRVVPDPGRKPTEFGQTYWNRLTSPRTYSGGAMWAIGIVQRCGAMDEAAMNFRLKSPGNYTLTGLLHFTTCSYSLMPGFANGAYFGGCTGTPTSTPITHRYHSGCAGILTPGHSATIRFDPALCFLSECRWTNTGSDFIHARDLPPTPMTQRHFDNDANIPLRKITGTSARADGSPLLWDGSLDRMRILDSASGNYVGDAVDGTEFAVFEIDPESTPWNPRVESTKPNHPQQWFTAAINETGQSNPLAVVPTDKLAKNVPASKRFTGWNNLNIHAYQPSESGQPFILKFHRVQGWTAPVRVGGISSLSEYALGVGSVSKKTMEPTITCSTKWSVLNFVGRKIVADAR